MHRTISARKKLFVSQPVTTQTITTLFFVVSAPLWNLHFNCVAITWHFMCHIAHTFGGKVGTGTLCTENVHIKSQVNSTLDSWGSEKTHKINPSGRTLYLRSIILIYYFPFSFSRCILYHIHLSVFAVDKTLWLNVKSSTLLSLLHMFFSGSGNAKLHLPLATAGWSKSVELSWQQLLRSVKTHSNGLGQPPKEGHGFFATLFRDLRGNTSAHERACTLFAIM